MHELCFHGIHNVYYIGVNISDGASRKFLSRSLFLEYFIFIALILENQLHTNKLMRTVLICLLPFSSTWDTDHQLRANIFDKTII